jgi:hypothetical protein
MVNLGANLPNVASPHRQAFYHKSGDNQRRKMFPERMRHVYPQRAVWWFRADEGVERSVSENYLFSARVGRRVQHGGSCADSGCASFHSPDCEAPESA